MLASGTTNWYFTSPEWTTPKNYLIKSKAEDDVEMLKLHLLVIHSYLIQLHYSSISLPTNNAKLQSLSYVSGTASDPAPGSACHKSKF